MFKIFKNLFGGKKKDKAEKTYNKEEIILERS
jgi:hypothetical protein